MQIVVDKKHYDFIERCYIVHKWVVIVSKRDLPYGLVGAVEEGSHTLLYMGEQEYLDVETKLTDLIDKKQAMYIKSHEELISDVSMTHMKRIKLPFITCMLQIVIVPEARSCL